jgi:hypothetical protein
MSPSAAKFIKVLLKEGMGPEDVLLAAQKKFSGIELAVIEELIHNEIKALNNPLGTDHPELTKVQEQQLLNIKNSACKRLANGESVENARLELEGLGLPSHLVEIAFEELRIQLGLIYEWPVGGLAKVVGPEWYPGPDADSKYWLGLRENLESVLDETAVAELDTSSTRIVSCLPPPFSADFSGRGLVLGYVQSGKTTSFMSVIAKAADAGYKLVIVLSGTTNNLRSQTQNRLEQQLTEGEHSWHWLTDSEKDFTTSGNAGNLLQTPNIRLIAVVKKHKRRLDLLRKWLNSANSLSRGNLPVLIIDDESDQASINTARQKNSRTAVNKALHDLVDSKFLKKVAYIGYSATPFANMLIDATDSESLYPRDFVNSLPRNPDYFGPERIFGSSLLREDEPDFGMDVIRDIPNSDVDLLKPAKGKALAWKPVATESLKDSVRWFLIASAVRVLRGQGDSWTTMMVHTSPNVKQHESVAELVSDLVKEWSADLIKFAIDCKNQIVEEVERTRDFASEDIVSISTNAEHIEFQNALFEVISKTRVLIDNYVSQDRLDYTGDSYPVIVVGGNTLSRGLTLEGLVSTFFLRTSSAYDSLLQMGRWFGYRKGYEDLQRMWLANEDPYLLSTWFRRLAFVEQEIRDQIDEMTTSGVTPSEIGIRIRKLPGLSITAASKMRHAVKAELSYAGTQPQTILFSESLEVQASNLAAVKSLAAELSPKLIRDKNWPRSLGVSSDVVLDFIGKYSFPPNSVVLQSKRIANYISKLNNDEELLLWNVVFYNNARKEAEPHLILDSLEIRMANRSRMKSVTESIDIKTLISVGDLVADAPHLKQEQKKEDGTLKKSDLLRARALDGATAGRGLLGVYLIDPQSKPTFKESLNDRVPLNLETPLVALYFVFPETKNVSAADFYIPNLLDKAELEAADSDLEDYLDGKNPGAEVQNG